MSNRMVLDIQEEAIRVTTWRDGIASSKMTNLQAIQEVLTRNVRIETPLLPSSWGVQKYVKVDDRELFVISTEPSTRTVYYDYGGNRREFVIPVPGLLWFVEARTYPGTENRDYSHGYVYALKHQVLSEKDALYMFPFCNVDSSYICWGSHRAPNWTSSKGVMSIADSFFNASFNGDLGTNKYRSFIAMREKGGEIEHSRTNHLIEYLAEEQKKAEKESKPPISFKYDVLHKQSTVGEAIEHWTRHLGNR